MKRSTKEVQQPKPSETRPVAESFGLRGMCRSSITAQRRFLCAVSLGCRCNSTPAISIGLLSLHKPGQTRVLSDIYPLKYSLLLALPTHKTWREKKSQLYTTCLVSPQGWNPPFLIRSIHVRQEAGFSAISEVL